MQENLSIARPYAKALFESAVEERCLTDWDSRLQSLRVIMHDPQIQKLLANPFLDAEFWVGLLSQALKEPASDAFTRFIEVLHRYRRLATIPAIQQLFHEYVLEKEGRVAITIRSAQSLSTEQQVALKAALEKQLKCGLELTYETNPLLMAGIQLVRGNHILDGSLLKRLEQISDYLKV
ncbi:MAG: F0F1 ATP synthase subunit delta [Pseudomonadota bacterium]